MRKLLFILVFILLLTACGGANPTDTPVPPTDTPASQAQVEPSPTPVPPTDTPTAPRTIRLMSHDSFAASEEVIAEFENTYNAKIELLPSGDAGAALNQAILSKNNPLADVFFGVDNTFLSRALEAGIFEPYASPALEGIPDELELDPEHRLLPVDYGDVCLNYDIAWFQEHNLTPPAKLEDLTRPEYKGLLVVENPATSSPGLAFMLATIGHFGEEGWLDYWAALRDNDVLVTSGWEDAYWGQSTWAGEGDRPIVVSYATSPAAEVYFSEGKLSEPPTGNVLGAGSCFRQIEFVGILAGTQNRDLAEKLVDFMLSQRFQEDIPVQMFVFPALADAALPDFYQWAERPAEPAYVDAAAIQANRETWIQQWTKTVLR
ncbi:MAG: thiamine ABC transporter substrate-binding protein [Chloroflexi bacterium]|nr:MAG: thiamine ABC transporter substrate-binding protein [Chloroflexota bacterium]